MGVEDAITKGFEIGPLFGILVVLVVAVVGYLVLENRDSKRKADAEREKHNSHIMKKEEDYRKLEESTRKEQMMMMQQVTDAYRDQTKVMTELKGVLTNLFERELVAINLKLEKIMEEIKK